MAVLVLASGCGTPPWQVAQATASPSAARSTSTPVATRPPSVAPSATLAPVLNDLATGSAKRSLEAGGVRIKINYWSTLDLGEWTSTAAKPLNLSASASFIDGSPQDIFLSKVSFSMAVSGAKGPLASPATIVDQSPLTPGYLFTAPTSYGQVFTVPALAAGARSVTMTITYEMLVQSAPKSKTYAKQTASNDLTVPLAV